MTRFWWCHTVGCPNHNRARQVNTGPKVTATCSYCREKMKQRPVGELPPVPHNIRLGEE